METITRQTGGMKSGPIQLIEKHHILKALREMTANGAVGIPGKRKSKKYDLAYRGHKYPPKYVVSRAHTFVDKTELRGFRGGEGTNNFLIDRGFRIVDKNGRSVGIQAITEDEAAMYAEGRASYRLHRQLERNAKIAKIVKNKRLLKTGDLRCDVCSFSFRKKYGLIGSGFIEAHHTIPISKLRRRRYTKLSEMALVCSNCHRMLHRSNPVRSIKELKKVLKVDAAKQG